MTNATYVIKAIGQVFRREAFDRNNYTPTDFERIKWLADDATFPGAARLGITREHFLNAAAITLGTDNTRKTTFA